MRRNNLARNLERFELQRVIAEDDRLYKIDIKKNEQMRWDNAKLKLNNDIRCRQWMTDDAVSGMRKNLTPSFLERHKAKILPLAALGLVLAGVLGAMS